MKDKYKAAWLRLSAYALFTVWGCFVLLPYLVACLFGCWLVYAVLKAISMYWEMR